MTHCVKRVSSCDALALVARVTHDDTVSANGLPPKSAPLAERLAAAMAREGISSQRELGRRLGTDGSLVGKWLSGDVEQIKMLRHQTGLARELKTPPDYFMDRKRASRRLAIVEAQVGALRRLVVALAEKEGIEIPSVLLPEDGEQAL